MTFTEPLPDYLAEPSRLGDEISITGKWVPSKPGGRFRTTEESREMLQEWEDIHQGARADTGVLSTEINHAVGEDAVLVHHVFENADAVIHLAGEPIGGQRWTEQYKKRILDSRVIGTRDIAEAMRSLPNPPPVFISASGVGFYGDTGERLVTEVSPPGTDYISQVCVRWEKEAEQAEQGRPRPAGDATRARTAGRIGRRTFCGGWHVHSRPHAVHLRLRRPLVKQGGCSLGQRCVLPQPPVTGVQGRLLCRPPVARHGFRYECGIAPR